MWTSQHQELPSDSLTTVIVLAQKLKLHNPVLTAAPGVHEEMCLQTTQRNSRTVNNNSNEDTVDSSRWGESNTSTSASSTLSSVCGVNDKKGDKSPFLQRKQESEKAFECGNQKLNVSTSCQLQQYKIDQISTGSSYQKHHLARVSSSLHKSRAPSRILEGQRRPLFSQTAVDADTENDTDTETSNDTEIICTSDDELKSFGVEATSNSDYDDAFESVSDSSAKKDKSKSSGRLNLKSRLTSSRNQRQEILRARMSPSPMTKPCKENVRDAKVKGKPTAMSSMTPPNSSSPLKPFRHPHSGIQDLETKFCRFSPLRQRTGKSDTDSDNQSLKTHPRILGKTQISDRQDDGLGASVDDNDDNVTLRNALHKPDRLNVPESRKKRNEGKKSRNFPVKKQGYVNGSDTSNTSSSSSLSYSPFTKFSSANSSSPLSQHADNKQHGGNSDQKERLEISRCPVNERLEISRCPVNEATYFGQQLHLLQSELVQLRHHDEKLARQFLQIYRDIQILKVQRACLDHQDLLDDAIDEVEERDRLLDLCDTPPLKHSGSKLRHCGLTKMNICSRRFSCS